MEGFLEDVGFVNVVKVKPSLGPNTLASEVVVGIGESMLKVWHVLVRVFSTVIIKMAWVPRGIQRHNDVWE